MKHKSFKNTRAFIVFALQLCKALFVIMMFVTGKPDLQSELTQEVAEVFPKAKCAIEYFENLSKGEKI